MNWHDYFIKLARLVATKSKDSTKVGAILVGPEKEIRLTAFNGPPRGVADTPERFERPAKYLYASHAEANLIAFAARAGIQTGGCTVYVTHHPCAACARSLIQAGVRAVYFEPAEFAPGSQINQEISAAKEMLTEAGVLLWRIEDGRDPEIVFRQKR